ncbi:hypothetical protein EVAR_42724_1 [Eumeta japonica]|uniref:Uncharacterized protein n=1 Tax=Eumeta variegata TaxID=151549 RepID=A0A4C1XKU9_EUMVA|nr:hypothetical protein EVAR_42724_1 [Eumeta japonica]
MVEVAFASQAPACAGAHRTYPQAFDLQPGPSSPGRLCMRISASDHLLGGVTAQTDAAQPRRPHIADTSWGRTARDVASLINSTATLLWFISTFADLQHEWSKALATLENMSLEYQNNEGPSMKVTIWNRNLKLLNNMPINFTYEFWFHLDNSLIALSISPGTSPGQSRRVWEKYPYREIRSSRLDCGDEVRHLSRLVTRRGEKQTRKVRLERLSECDNDYECVNQRLLWLQVKIELPRILILGVCTSDMSKPLEKWEEF